MINKRTIDHLLPQLALKKILYKKDRSVGYEIFFFFFRPTTLFFSRFIRDTGLFLGLM